MDDRLAAQPNPKRKYVLSSQPEHLTMNDFPLLESAPILAQYANEYADVDPVYATHWAWYHRAWQYLRAADCVSSPLWHEAFYEGGFTRTFEKCGGSPAVLISGTADYSLLALVARAANVKAIEARITVADMSEPPLKICEWWASHYGVNVTTLRHDMLNAWPDEQVFNVITSDAFLTRFTTAEVQRIFAHWRRLLSNSGAIITTVRIREVGDPVATAKDKAGFVARAQDFFRSKGYSELEVIRIGELATAYVVQMTSHDLGNADQIRTHFRSAGFTIEHQEVALTRGEYTGTRYLRLVCHRATT
jgi:hypothetical protein